MRVDMKRPALGRTPPAGGVSTRSPVFRSLRSRSPSGRRWAL